MGRPVGTRPKLTRFGSVVLVLMHKSGLRYQRELLELLKERGYDVGQTRLSNWLYGRHGVAREFPAMLAEALDLSVEDRAELADAYTYGQVPEG